MLSDYPLHVLDNLFKYESKKSYTTINGFNQVDADIYSIGNIRVCTLWLTGPDGVISETYIPYPFKFTSSPYVTGTDFDVGLNSNHIYYGWGDKAGIKIKNANTGFALFVFGKV